MSSNVILFPDYEKLKADVDKLRAEISMLIYQRDELALVECKNIEMEYMLALGDLEYKAYELNCLVLRLKRKAEMIRARINRQEKIILSAIEAALDEEFADYQARLEEQINRMNAAIERDKCPSLSEEAFGELKKLYHAVVKALHPDLNPGTGPEKLKLFHNAVHAYENGDLNSIHGLRARSSAANGGRSDRAEAGARKALQPHRRLARGDREDQKRISLYGKRTCQQQREDCRKARRAGRADRTAPRSCRSL